MASIGIRKPGTAGKSGVATGGRLGALLFGLVFFGAGLVMGYFLVLPDFREWSAAREYQAVPAKLLSVELKRHRGRDSTTYNVRADYRYSFRGREYAGHRVAISDAADNIGDFQQDLYRRLKAAERRGGDVTAWVDPANPQRALLDRDMRWGLFALKALFAALFVLIGGAVAIFALRAPVASPAARAQIMVAQPRGRISANTRASMWFWWIFAVLWIAISSPGLFFLPKELTKGNYTALLILLFPAVGIWLLTMAVRSTLQWHRFGALALILAPYPGAIGGTVTGTIELPERFRGAQRFRVTMTCVHRHTSGTGKSRSIWDKALWQDETHARANASGRGTQLAFRFDVPAGLPPSSTPSNDYVFWAIDVAADLPGVDLDTRFDVPMAPAAPGTSSPANAPAVSAADTVPEIPPSIVRIFQQRDAKVFYYPLFRYPAMSVGLLVFGAIFFAPAVFLYAQLRGNVMDMMLWFMIAVFGLFGVLLLLGGIYSVGNTLRVEVSPRGLTTVRRIFGFGFSRYAPIEAIKSVETKIGSQSNSSGKIRVRYKLVAHINDGRKITVGADIPGHPLADRLARLVRDACGLDS